MLQVNHFAAIGLAVAEQNRRVFAVLQTLDQEERRQRRLRRQRRRTVWVRQYLTPEFRKQHSQYYTLVQTWRTSDVAMYKQYMRMEPALFDEILGRIQHRISRIATGMRDPIEPGLKLAVTLRMLATGHSNRDSSYNFLVSDSAISLFVPEVCQAILDQYTDEVMPLPRTPEDWKEIEQEFKERWNVPHAVGALDGRHCPIEKPQGGGSLYYNYKNFHSVVLMGLVDADYKFIWADVGGCGSMGDAQIYNHSDLKRAIESGETQLPPDDPLPNDDKDFPYFILADEAFALSTFLVKPYSRKLMERSLRIFNYRISRGRRVVENAFGIMSLKLQILQRPMNKNIHTCRTIIKTCVVLHNLLRLRYPNGHIGLVDAEDNEGNLQPGQWRNLVQMPDMDHVIGAGQASTQAKRNREYLRAYFSSPAGAVEWQDRMVQP